TDHAQSAGRWHGGGPARFPRARRHSRRVRHDRAHLRLLRILPARLLSLVADARTHRHRPGCAEYLRIVRRKILYRPAWRHSGELRASPEERLEGLRLSAAAEPD